MTKADVLDSFDTLEACTGYQTAGKLIKQMPFQLDQTQIKPFYRSFSGWKQDITAMRHSSELPGAMQSYIQFIEGYLGVSVKYISNGPDREQLIERLP